MIAVVDGEEIEAVLREEGGFWKVIEIDGEHEDTVFEGVLFWGDASVGHAAFV